MENYPLLKSQDMLTYDNPFIIKNSINGNISINVGDSVEVTTIYQPDFYNEYINKISYSWQKNGEVISTESTFIPESSGDYVCTVTYEGTAYNLEFNVTLDISSTIENVLITNYNNDLPMSESGTSISLTVQYECDIPCTTTWVLKSSKGEDTETTLSTNNPFSLTITEGNNDDIIYCKVSNEYLEVNSQELRIHTIMGTGTENDPYLIFNAYDWNYYSDIVATRSNDNIYLKQMKNITNNTLDTFYQSNGNYKLFYDGCGCVLDNININDISNTNTFTLFNVNNADIENIGVVNCNFVVQNRYLAMIAYGNYQNATAVNYVTLNNCFVENVNISGTYNTETKYCSALASNIGTLDNCYSYNINFTNNNAASDATKCNYYGFAYNIGTLTSCYTYKGSVDNVNQFLLFSTTNGATNAYSLDNYSITNVTTNLNDTMSSTIQKTSTQMESNEILTTLGSHYYFDTNTNHARLNISNHQLNPVISFPYTSPKVITDNDLATNELNIVINNLSSNSDYSIIWKKDNVELTGYKNYYSVPYSVLNDGEIYSKITVVVTSNNGGTATASIVLNPEIVLEQVPVSDTNQVYYNHYEVESYDLTNYIMTNLPTEKLTFEVLETSGNDFMSYTNLNSNIFTINSSPYSIETTVDITFKVYVTGFEDISGDVTIPFQVKVGFFPTDIQVSGMEDYYIVLPEQWNSDDGHTINFVLNQSNSNRISTPYNLKVTRLDGYDNTLLDTIINGSRNTNYVYESFSSAYRYEYNKNIFKFEITNEYGSFTKEFKFNINIGNGTSDAPLLVFDADDMLHIEDFMIAANRGIGISDNTLYVRQMNHVDFSGYGKMNRLVNLDNIIMNYNGNSYKIENLYLEAGNQTSVGMFKNVGTPFTIDAVEICNCTLDINNSSITSAGLLFDTISSNIIMMTGIIIHDIDIIDTNNNNFYTNANIGLISGSVEYDTPHGYVQQQGYISNITLNTGKIQNFGYVYGNVLFNYGGFDGYYIHDIHNINAVNCGVIGNWQDYTWKDYSTNHAYICSSTISFLSSDTNVGEEFTEITETQITDGTLLGNLNYGGNTWYASENGIPKPITYNPEYLNYESPNALYDIIHAYTPSLKFIYLNVQYPGFYKPWKVEVQKTSNPDNPPESISSNISGNELYMISVDQGGTLTIKLTNNNNVSITLNNIDVSVG